MKKLLLSLLVGLLVPCWGCVTPNSTREAQEVLVPSIPVETANGAAHRSDAELESRVVRQASLESPVFEDEIQGVSGRPVVIPVAAEMPRATPDANDKTTDANPTYSLQEIEQMAISNNPAILAAEATLGISSGLYRQVGARPNPVLGYFGQQVADRNTDQHGLYLEQEFVRGDKLALNRDVLRHTHHAQLQELETQRLRVQTDVRVRFYEALAAQNQRDLTLQFVEVARQGVEIAKQRHEAEEGSLVEALQSETLLSEVTLAAEQADATYRAAWRDLAAIAGLSQECPSHLAEPIEISDDRPDWDVAYADICAQSPELHAARAIVCEKQAILRRQRVQAVPNLTGQLGVGHDRATNHEMLNLQVSMPIPVHNQNNGNISAAYHDYIRANQEVARIEQSIRSRLARARQQFETSMATVVKYEREILPALTQSLALSEEAYRAGEQAFLQVLIVRRSYYESALRLAQAKGSLAQAAAKVDGRLLTGGLDAPLDYTAGDGLRGASFDGQ